MDNYKVKTERKRRREIKILPNGNIKVIKFKKKRPKKSLVNRDKIILVARKVGDHVQKNSKKYFMGSAIAAVSMVVITGILVLILSSLPYAINVDGNAICYVNGKLQGEKVVENVLAEYTPDEATIKAVDTEERFEIVRVSRFDVDKTKLMSIKNATEYILNDYQKSDNALTVTIASTRTTEEKYIPEPKYQKDNKMLAGDSKVIKKGKDGKQEVSVTYITVNGKIESKDITATKILDKGKPATVKKGTLGLPDGEDWKTFNGDPIFKNGDELGTTALQYLGAPYKYGGTSLTHGIDCVQFVRQMYAKYGIHLSNSDVYHGGKGVSLKNAKRGDIVCYNHHVAIYLGDGKVVHALNKGVSVSNVNFRKIKSIRRIVN